MQDIITSNNLIKSYSGAVNVLDGLDLCIKDGEFVSILGESGSGKSTLLYALVGLEKVNSGDISVLGENITSMSAEELAKFRRTNIGFIHQSYNLLINMNVEDNIMLPLILLKCGKGAREKVNRVLEYVGLQGRNKSAITELSGGEQQRVGIARALIHEPRIIVADEATGNLDSANAQKIMELLTDINGRYNTTILQVTHSKSIAEYSQRKIYIKDGKIITDGNS